MAQNLFMKTARKWTLGFVAACAGISGLGCGHKANSPDYMHDMVVPTEKSEPYPGQFEFYIHTDAIFYDRREQDRFWTQIRAEAIGKLILADNKTFTLTLKTRAQTVMESGTWDSDSNFHILNVDVDGQEVDPSKAPITKVWPKQGEPEGPLLQEIRGKYKHTLSMGWGRTSGFILIFPWGEEHR